MIKLGEIQTLQILKKVDFGVYLWDGEDKEERVLLPKKQLPEQAQVGDTVEVFIMPSEAFIRGHVSGHVIYSILVLRPKINTPFIFSVLCTFSGMKTGKYDFIRILRRALPCPGTHSSSEERPRLRHFFIVFPPEIIYNVGTQSVPRYIPSSKMLTPYCGNCIPRV